MSQPRVHLLKTHPLNSRYMAGWSVATCTGRLTSSPLTDDKAAVTCVNCRRRFDPPPRRTLRYGLREADHARVVAYAHAEGLTVTAALRALVCISRNREQH
mgnify:CR=1 FL=1